MAKILANDINVRKVQWNGKTIKSISVRYDNNFYGLKGYQANKFEKQNGIETDVPLIKEGQPLSGVIETYTYQKKDKETKQPTGEIGTGFNFVIYNPVEADFDNRIEALEKFMKGSFDTSSNNIIEDEIDVEDIPF